MTAHDDSPDNLESDLDPTLARAGGSVGFMEQAAPGPDGALPLVVWLRGDEPLCDEFTLDAEAVMAQLGIRRSRLTQISGRELRVGRMRKGRYVSPVYRQCDVDAYIAWTRPTASHQKSSSVLQEAADALRSQKDELAAQMETGFDQTLAAVETAVRLSGVEAARRGAEAETRLADLLAASEDALRETIARALQPVAALHARLDAVVAQMEKLAVAQSLLAREIAETAALTRANREDDRVRHAVVDAALGRLREDVAQIVDGVAALGAARVPPKKARAPKSARPKTERRSNVSEPSLGQLRRAARRKPR